MNIFEQFINIIVTGAVGLSLIRVYLQVNKIWIRKHEHVVAESISIAANSIGIAVNIPFFFRFLLIDRNIPAALNSVVIFCGLCMSILIGTGLWVRANKDDSFFTLLKKALRLEREESGTLIMALVRPSGSEKIIKILKNLAAIDKEIGVKEIELINLHAKEWGISGIDLKPGPVENIVTLSELRASMEDYLDISPPTEQVEAMGYLIKVMIKADGIVQEEEEIVFNELHGMIENYVQEGVAVGPRYMVLVVPQNDGQYTTIQELLPKTECEEHRGGRAFRAGEFYSIEFAEAMSHKYIGLGLFSTVVDKEAKLVVAEQ